MTRVPTAVATCIGPVSLDGPASAIAAAPLPAAQRRCVRLEVGVQRRVLGTGVGVRKHVTQRLEDLVRNRMSSAGARRSPQGWSEIEDLGRHAAVIGRLLSV